MAEAGDVDGLWEALHTEDHTGLAWRWLLGHLLQAVEVRCQQDPARFAGEMFGRMMSLTSYLLLRTQFYATKLVRKHDSTGRECWSGALPHELTDQVLPRLMELQGHLAEVAHAQASVARLWKLARGKQTENEHGGHRSRGSAEPTIRQTGPEVISPNNIEAQGGPPVDHRDKNGSAEREPCTCRRPGGEVGGDPGEGRAVR
jgi:hypothetical protein